MKKNHKIFLSHILESIEAIEKHTRHISKRQFFESLLIQDAVMRRVEIIGEAVKNMPADYKKRHPGIEWREVAGMRDKLIHEYFGVDLNIVWLTVKKDIPELKKRISGLFDGD